MIKFDSPVFKSLFAIQVKFVNIFQKIFPFKNNSVRYSCIGMASLTLIFSCGDSVLASLLPMQKKRS